MDSDLQVPLIVRSAAETDLGSLTALAASAGPGMTTVPQGEAAISARIEASTRAFSSKGKASAADTFFFVLDDGHGAAGMGCVFPDLGGDRPFYSYRLSHIAAQSPELDLRASSDILFLVNDFHGYSELATLFIGAAARSRGAGRFLSLARLFYMGLHRDRFGADVMAEIRGWFDESGNNPFWGYIAAKFFHTSFEEADRQSANDFRFISHLMPKFPIYVALLPPEAQTVIGKPHQTSHRAMSMLQAEGFAYTRCVDIFDGGPSIECPLAQARIVRETAERSLVVVSEDTRQADDVDFILCAPPPADFAAVRGWGARIGDQVKLSPEAAARAGLDAGQTVMAAPLKGH